MNSPWEPHPDGQDQPFLLLGSSELQPHIYCPSPQTICEQIIYLQGTHDLDLSPNF